MAPTGSSWPCREDSTFHKIWESVQPYTMTSPERGYALYKSVNYVIDQKIPGSFVECGVWRGGSSMLIALTLSARNITNRNVVLIDTFKGMTPASDQDVDLNGNKAEALMDGIQGEKLAELVKAEASLHDVQANMQRTGYNPRRIRYVKGDVRGILPSVQTSMISLLRLDTDFHDSTLAELEALYPRVAQHGIVIIDDMGHWKGAAQAVDDYFEKTKDSHKYPMMWALDYTGRGFVKPDLPGKAGKVSIERYDYIPPDFKDPKLLGYFSNAEVVDAWQVKWPYLRPMTPHHFRNDARNPKSFVIGYASYEEVMCLYALACQFKGKRGLEIGSYFGWTSAHLFKAGIILDCVDISFADPTRKNAVATVFDQLQSDKNTYKLWSDPSPDCIDEVYQSRPEPWSFAFIDGNHDGEAPANDARAVLPHMADNAVVVFHDMTSPYVAAGLEVFREAGWNVTIWNTMQILGIAWRGDVEIPEHIPDPNTPQVFYQHLDSLIPPEPLIP